MFDYILDMSLVLVIKMLKLAIKWLMKYPVILRLPDTKAVTQTILLHTKYTPLKLAVKPYSRNNNSDFGTAWNETIRFVNLKIKHAYDINPCDAYVKNTYSKKRLYEK